MSVMTAIRGARIFDGHQWHEDKNLLILDGRIKAIVAANELPADVTAIEYDGQLVVPGFIDLQVNGGGGVQFGDGASPEAIGRMTAAHAKFGTTALLPTLITDTVDVTEAALEAGRLARQEEVPGFLGLHLEGPHLSLARKGAHDPSMIRPMEQTDLQRILDYRDAVGVMMTTIAPENVTPDQVSGLADAGVLVSVGHTDASAQTALSYFAAGARMVTHLFNAMSPLSHREPGLVGAALHSGDIFAGMIADGFHIDAIAMGVALRAKRDPGKIFLVTDAMSPLGTDMIGLELNGRQIFRRDGRLTLADGTLAGADIDMLSCVRFVVQKLGLPLDEALRMASFYPAQAARIERERGQLSSGSCADFVVLTPDLCHVSTWIGGQTAC